MKTKVVLTVDTEPSIAGAFSANSSLKPLIHEPVAGTVDGKSEALGFIVRTLVKHSLEATFFVETVHTSFFPETEMEKHVQLLQDANQDVQLHLHPCWRTFLQGAINPDNLASDHCHTVPVDELAEMISAGADLIKRWTGRRAIAMRTGNFSTGPNVYTALSQAGLSYSSNICLAVSPPEASELQVPHGVHNFNGVCELPVTCFKDRGPIGRGRWKPMQITSLSAQEQMDLLTKAHIAGYPVVVIVTHPFEFVKRDDAQFSNMRSNRMIQKRFANLCSWLEENEDCFEVTNIADACESVGHVNAKFDDLHGSALRSLIRSATNFGNDKLPL